MTEFIIFLMAGIGITNLIVNAVILDRPRNELMKIPILEKLLTCMMCSGFWVGFILALFTGPSPLLAAPIISLLSYTYGIVIDLIEVTTATKAEFLEDND